MIFYYVYNRDNGRTYGLEIYIRAVYIKIPSLLFVIFLISSIKFNPYVIGVFVYKKNSAHL